MKKIYSFIITLILSFSLFTTVFADTGARVLDNADLMEDSQQQLLEDKIQGIAEKYDFDVVILTTNSCEGKSVTAYADDAFDYGSYGLGSNRDGLLFLISMEERDWYISTSGYGEEAFTDYGIQALGEEMVPYLGDGNYYEAFEVLLDEIPGYLDQSLAGEPVDTYVPDSSYEPGTSYEEEGRSTVPFIAVIGISLVISLGVVFVMKSQMKTAKPQKMAHEYVARDSFKLTSRQDIYLYSNVTKTKKPTQNNNGGGSSTHTSSSGRSHGGGGGKF